MFDLLPCHVHAADCPQRLSTCISQFYTEHPVDKRQHLDDQVLKSQGSPGQDEKYCVPRWVSNEHSPTLVKVYDGWCQGQKEV
jgi:hypothetical protein